MVIHSQHKHVCHFNRMKKVLLHKAEVFHHFQLRPVVWVALLVSNAPNHELESNQSDWKRKKTKHQLDILPSVINPCIQPSQFNSSLSHKSNWSWRVETYSSPSFIQWICFPVSSTAFSHSFKPQMIWTGLAHVKKDNVKIVHWRIYDLF